MGIYDNYFWGLPVPEGTPSAWGARAIFNHMQEYMDLLPDRQGVQGTNQIVNVLNKGGVLKLAQAKFKELVQDGEITTRESKRVVLYESKMVEVFGNSNASHGYFYVSAYIKPPPALPLVADYENYEEGKNIVWRGDLPEVGQEIEVTVNSLGRGVVLGHVPGGRYEEAFLFIIVHLHSPPKWWEEQRAHANRPYWCHIMGPEWKPIEAKEAV